MDVGLKKTQQLFIIGYLPLSNDALMGLFNSSRQRFENRFQALENLLGLRTGAVSSLRVLIEKAEVTLGMGAHYGHERVHLEQHPLALFVAILLAPGLGHLHRQAVDLGDEDLRLAHL